MEKERTDSIKLSKRQELIFVTAGLAISLLFVLVFSRVTMGISAGMTYNATLSVKKNMLQENVNNMISYIDYSKEEYLAEHPGATDQEVEDAMGELVRKRIYSEEHMDGSYMWVEKVLDYDGGDDYAIRLIHPNLTDTEGDYLTTNEVNSMGQKPYEEELEGIKKDGDIFLTYEFKKLDSDEVTGKVCYSKLYKDFDWIIAMGVNFDDLDHYRRQAADNMRLYQITILAAIVATWMLLIGLISYAARRNAIKAYKNRNKELAERLDRDVVTGANSRDFGEEMLEKELKDFMDGRKDTLLLMLDVDFFKQFNDTYGHELGDKVLKAVVDAVKGSIRESDSVIRWGGDEFIVIMHDVPAEHQGEAGDRIINAIRSIELPELTDGHKVTSSMGFAYFEEGDTEVINVLNRADDALYIAKENGRNNWQIVTGGKK
jgi:diguanylate cyclase (GGDEF)-like protein